MKKLKLALITLSFMMLSNDLMSNNEESPCQCSYTVHFGWVEIYKEVHDYWGQYNCCVVLGAIYSEYYMFGNQYDPGTVMVGAPCCGQHMY